MTDSLRSALSQALRAQRTLNFYDFSGLNSSVSFEDFGRRSQELAERYRELGIGPGKVVALMGPTSLELTSHCLAVWFCGATLMVLPMPTRLGNLELFLSETLEKLQRGRASLLVADEGSVSVFAEMAGIPVLSWSAVEEPATDINLMGAVLGRDDVGLIQFSSGTTRSPQPILLSQAALLHNARAVLECFPGGAENHSCVSWLPLYHDMGLIGCFLMPLLAPGNLTLMGPEVFAVKPYMWLRAITEQRATTSSAPNFALAYCADRVRDSLLGELDLSCWEIAMVGAEAVRPKTLRRFAERFAPAGFRESAFSPVYGLAEATLAVTFSPLGRGLRTLSYDADGLASRGGVEPGAFESPCLGRPLKGVEVEIRRSGQEVEERTLGDVWVRSESLLSGVLEDGELKDPLEEGWLDTGDAGFLVNGELYLYGRRRDILLLDGRNHDPGLVEESAESLEPVRRACAFCLEEGEQEKDVLVVLCEVSKKWDGEVDNLKSSVRSAVRRGTGLVPGRVVLLRPGELPLTSSGKLQRARAAKLYLDEELRIVESTAV